MKKLGLLAAAALTVTTLTTAPAQAAQCAPGGLGPIPLGTGGPGTVYIDDRGVSNGTWIYLESNGMHDLQRGGTTLGGETDQCNDSETPDTAVF